MDGTATYYLLDGDEEIAEYDSAGAVLRRFIMGPAIDDRVATAEGSAITNPTKTYYHVNHQGSVIAMTDSAGNAAGCASGVNCQKLSYDEYGNLSSASSATGQPYRYTGRRFDSETGLYYYRARYYSPELGRFLQTDPVGYSADTNLYTYVGNDPANKMDATGECPWCVVGAAVSAGIQFYIEQRNAGGWRNIDSDGVKRILISGAAGALGGRGRHSHCQADRLGSPRCCGSWRRC